MAFITNINKSSVPTNTDLFDRESNVTVIQRSARGVAQGRAAVGMHNYVATVAMNRELKQGASQGDLLDLCGISQGQMSKMIQVVRAIEAHTAGADVAVEGLPESKVDFEKLETQRSNLVTFWGFVKDRNPDTPDCYETLKALIGDDGEERAKALPVVQTILGSPSSAYRIANGEVFHEEDPRSKAEDDEPGDEPGDDDDEPTAWQDLIKQALVQARHQGATVSDVVAVVNAAYKD